MNPETAQKVLHFLRSTVTVKEGKWEAAETHTSPDSAALTKKLSEGGRTRQEGRWMNAGKLSLLTLWMNMCLLCLYDVVVQQEQLQGKLYIR